MARIIKEQPHGKNENKLAVVSYLPENTVSNQALANVITHPHPTTQLMLASKLITHVPEAGLNPIVDAAAPLFSTMAKLIHLKANDDLAGLHQELVEEIENFQATIQSYSYKAEHLAEYVPITCYALCVTFDDIIFSTTWGGQGKWEEYSLVDTFIPDPPSQTSFFVILERLIRDPDIYIDMMEFMYICLSLGFKCRNQANAPEFNHEQLEQIIHSLFKRIRAHDGNFSKILSPFPIRPTITNNAPKKFPYWATILISGGIVTLLVIAGAYWFRSII